MAEQYSPDITLFHILPRLPVKSVTRFKCVSKEWHSFITTPQFPKMHLHHQNHQKLLLLPHDKPWDFFTIDCETPEDGCTAIRPFPFKVEHGQIVSIATSLHGMVCVFLTDLSKRIAHDILVWNPVTGDHKTLSKAGSHKDCYKTSKARYGLYYSCSEDDYKLVCLIEDPNIINVYLYSLKSDFWRKVESTSWCTDHRYEYVHWERSIFLNEKLYFVNSYSIVMFDTQTEKLRDIKAPFFGNQRKCCTGFMVVRDCNIHFCVAIMNSISRYDVIEEWRIDGDGDWTKVETSSLREQLYYFEDPQHMMRNGNWLMYSDKPQHLSRNQHWPMHNTCGGCVYVLDAKHHAKHFMCSTKFAFRPKGRYIDTFMSPNRYLK